MRKTIIINILFCMTIGLSAQSSYTRKLKVANPHDVAQTDMPVSLDISDIRKRRFDVQSATVTAQSTGQSMAWQLDDLDGDGHADELFFLANLAASQKETFIVTLFPDSSAWQDFPRRVYADMMLDDKKSRHPLITSLEAPGDSYLYNDLYHHGAAFESELTGYRVYFDQRQNIDIYGKRLRRIELPVTNFYTTPEQMAQQYGNDVLWAGNSIGCGSFKGWDGTSPTNIEPVVRRSQRVIASGPLRTIVEVKDIGWNGLNMCQRYTLCAGHRECRVDIQFDGQFRDRSFATGVQKVGSQPRGFVRPDGIAASWGSDYPEMGKKEQFPPETVGLAVYVPTPYIRSQSESELNYLFELRPDATGHLHYFVAFCADKEADGFHSADEWFSWLEKWKTQLEK